MILSEKSATFRDHALNWLLMSNLQNCNSALNFASEWRFSRRSAHISVGCFYHESPRRIGRGHASAELLIKNLVAYSRRSFPLADGGTRAADRDAQASGDCA